MKEADWQDCLVCRSARFITPDPERAKSLAETAQERISLIGQVNARNCNYVFEDYYISLVELLQAIAFINGFNILNHLCLGFYLRDVLHQHALFREFDDLRYKRNSLTYYGKRMDYRAAVRSIQQSRRIFDELHSVFLRSESTTSS